MIARRLYVVSLLALALGLTGCPASSGDGSGGGSGRTRFLSIGTSPLGGAFPIVGQDMAEVMNNNRGENNWKAQARGTKGSQENIRRLEDGKLELALSNAAITYFAVRGESGWDKKFNSRSIFTMAPNVAMFITKADSGIKTIQDLKGKRVVIGPSGAGFEMFVNPILQEHGVEPTDINSVNATQSGAVEMMGDGQADAAFLGGALPTAAIGQACSTYDIFFIPFDPEVRERLIEKYPFFQAATIPKKVYTDLEGDYAGLNVGSMHLITSADQDEEFIYQITKTIWEHRDEISHPAGRSINEENAPRYAGTEFHPGAIRYFKEIGIWPEDVATGPATDAPATDAPAKPADAAAKPADAEVPADAPVKPADADAPVKPADVDAKPADSDVKPADAPAKDADVDAPAKPAPAEEDKTPAPTGGA